MNIPTGTGQPPPAKQRILKICRRISHNYWGQPAGYYLLIWAAILLISLTPAPENYDTSLFSAAVGAHIILALLIAPQITLRLARRRRRSRQGRQEVSTLPETPTLYTVSLTREQADRVAELLGPEGPRLIPSSPENPPASGC